MLSSTRLRRTKKCYTNISMSKTTRKKNDEFALSKNNGDKFQYLKRLAEEREAEEERKKALEELNKTYEQR